MGFNLKILVLNRNLFWQKSWFFYLCLIANKTLLFIAWNLVWFDVYVAKFEFEYFFILFIFLGVWSVFVTKFYVICVFFLVLILFRFKFLFWFSFWLNLGFWFGSWWNQCFRVYLVRSKPGQILKALFGLPLFW
jgi:hypothetical protein